MSFINFDVGMICYDFIETKIKNCFKKRKKCVFLDAKKYSFLIITIYCE